MNDFWLVDLGDEGWLAVPWHPFDTEAHILSLVGGGHSATVVERQIAEALVPNSPCFVHERAGLDAAIAVLTG